MESVFTSNRNVGSNPTLSASTSNLFPCSWRLAFLRVPLVYPSSRQYGMILRESILGEIRNVAVYDRSVATV